MREDTLVTVPRVGAFVKSLTLEEFEQIYPIRALLDPEALRLAGLPSRQLIERLDRRNSRIGTATDADAIIALDDEWHLLLIDNCPNKVLIDLIQRFMRRTRRYELALMRERQQIDVATDAHSEIIAALRRGALEAAAGILKRHLETRWRADPPLAARTGGSIVKSVTSAFAAALLHLGSPVEAQSADQLIGIWRGDVSVRSEAPGAPHRSADCSGYAASIGGQHAASNGGGDIRLTFGRDGNFRGRRRRRLLEGFWIRPQQ